LRVIEGYGALPALGLLDQLQVGDTGPAESTRQGNLQRVGLLFLGSRDSSFSFPSMPLKGPKLEIFGSGVFTQIKPVWVGDLGTRPKIQKLKICHFVLFIAVAGIANNF
jgi:hypothetical protein